MKILTNEEIITLLENCGIAVCNNADTLNSDCPLAKECRYYYTMEKCGSALEIESKGDKK